MTIRPSEFEARSESSQTCLSYDGNDFSWKRIFTKRDTYLHRMRKCKVHRPLVVWSGANHPDALSLWLAASTAGLSFHPTWSATSSTISVLRESTGMLIFHEDGRTDIFPNPQSRSTSADQSEMVLPSSGTTGSGKLCRLSWPMMKANAKAARVILNLHEADRPVISSSFQHTAGWNTFLMTCLLQEHPVELLRQYSAKKILKLMRDSSRGIFHLSPVQAGHLLMDRNWSDIPQRPQSTVVIGSSDVYPHLIRSFCAKGFTVIRNYGLTEVGPFAISRRTSLAQVENQNLFDLGQVAEGLRHQVRNGVLELQGDAVFSGHFGDTDSRRGDEWFNTGDLVRLEGDQLYFEGRVTDTFDIQGVRIHPNLVERHIFARFPTTHEVLVAKDRASDWPRLIVRLRPRFGEAAPKLGHVAIEVEKLLGLKANSVLVELVRKLKRTQSGKLLRESINNEQYFNGGGTQYEGPGPSSSIAEVL